MKSYAFDKPDTMPVAPENIPPSLRRFDQWVVWRHLWQGGRWRQVPVNAKTGRPASVTRRSSLSCFEEAMACHEGGDADGVGFVLGGLVDNCFVGVSLKNAYDPDFEVIEPWAADILRRLNTYCERSPDGRDVKAFVSGYTPRAGMVDTRAEGGRVCLYSANRFFTVTGARLPEYAAEVAPNQAALDDIIDNYFAPRRR